MTCPGSGRVPPKAKWIRFETDDLFHFEFFLAERLHLTVRELRQTLDMDELVSWSVYYGRKAQQKQLAAMQAR